MLSKKSQIQLIEKLKAIGELFDDTTWDERKIPGERSAWHVDGAGNTALVL